MGLSGDPQKAARQLSALARNNPSLAARLSPAEPGGSPAGQADAGPSPAGPGERRASPVQASAAEPARGRPGDRRLDYAGYGAETPTQEASDLGYEPRPDTAVVLADASGEASGRIGPLGSFLQGSRTASAPRRR